MRDKRKVIIIAIMGVLATAIVIIAGVAIGGRNKEKVQEKAKNDVVSDTEKEPSRKKDEAVEGDFAGDNDSEFVQSDTGTFRSIQNDTGTSGTPGTEVGDNNAAFDEGNTGEQGMDSDDKTDKTEGPNTKEDSDWTHYY